MPLEAELLVCMDSTNGTLSFRLEDNYEMVPGACLPRSVLYTHYQDYCKRNQMEPSSAASFGKVNYVILVVVFMGSCTIFQIDLYIMHVSFFSVISYHRHVSFTFTDHPHEVP